MECNSKLYVTQMDFHLKYNVIKKWNVTQNEMSLKINVIKNGMSLKIECHSKWSVT